MEDAPPSLEISTTQSSGEGVAELGREDIAGKRLSAPACYPQRTRLLI